MLADKLDLIFPFFVFAYGALMTFILHSEFFTELAEHRLPPAIYTQMRAHRGLGLICLLVGGFWSLQNLWL